MTPVPFALPASRRVLPPGVAYAAGLVCERYPVLADEVREAVLGDAALYSLSALTITRVDAVDEQGASALTYLHEIVHYGGNDPKALHGLADLLGLIPRRTAEMYIKTLDRAERVGDPTIGDVARHSLLDAPWVVGLDRPDWVWMMADARDAADLLDEYLRAGWDWAWERATLPGEREALRHLIPIHAHTVSPDPATRAAWAKAHLDALEAL